MKCKDTHCGVNIKAALLCIATLKICCLLKSIDALLLWYMCSTL